MLHQAINLLYSVLGCHQLEHKLNDSKIQIKQSHVTLD
jgi:hypothetical protein